MAAAEAVGQRCLLTSPRFRDRSEDLYEFLGLLQLSDHGLNLFFLFHLLH